MSQFSIEVFVHTEYESFKSKGFAFFSCVKKNFSLFVFLLLFSPWSTQLNKGTVCKPHHCIMIFARLENSKMVYSLSSRMKTTNMSMHSQYIHTHNHNHKCAHPVGRCECEKNEIGRASKQLKKKKKKEKSGTTLSIQPAYAVRWNNKAV